MYVIGTAGHVDHGKSRLVLALTGIDPDRLREEKERGLTIDLGFAWFTLPSGREVSIVDVPGHERFIKNMLAGVGGIDLALLVVAADEGVMPQTREHLAILDLLEVRQGVVALTKCDLVDGDWLTLVEAEVVDLLAPTTLAGAPLVRCSAVSGAGLDALRAALDKALAALPPVRDIGRPWLPVDRVFTVAGFGTVVTGTLVEGPLRVGDSVAVEPGGLRARVRGLQSHKQTLAVAPPGARTAVNLSGLATEEVQRGTIVTVAGWLRSTRVMDVRLRALAGLTRPITHNAAVTVHTGAAEAAARVRLLEGDELLPGREGWAQLRLEHAVAAARGDFFVIRSPVTTVGGGRIVDVRPRRHKRNERATLAALARLMTGSPDDAVFTLLQRAGPLALGELRLRAELDERAGREAVERQIARGAVVALDDDLSASSVLATAEGLDALGERAVALAAAFAAEHPLRPGIPQEELRSRLGLPGKAFAALERRLLAAKRLTVGDGTLAAPGAGAALTEEQRTTVERFLAQLKEAGSRPRTSDRIDPELAAYLEAQGAIVRAGPDVSFDAAVHAEMVDRVVAALRQQGQITLAEVRDLLGTSRKVGQAFLEDLDRRRITRRVGDVRVLRGASGDGEQPG